ncbi:putative mapkkk cascade protein kinase regulator ste50 [Diplodia seriata]|uniref:Putative mapkkk cascade protein kinase regulator ste50 n=1 Tax=Diplodia seriata TaxID=420778 RepID=A0A0G2H389_9PEZI|nr:putative mapkkk cascade protein kinase regulator ste50 [Diplodia seriata]
MTDPLSVVGSIVGIAATGVSVSLTLYQFADEVGSAAKDAKQIGSEISNFCFILRILASTLEEADAASVLHCKDVAEKMNERCLAMFVEIIELVNELQKHVGIPGENSSKWTKRIRWALQKPRIMYLRASLDTYKATLSLMLETLHLADKIAKRRTIFSDVADPEDDGQQRSLIESLERANRASITELQELEEQKFDEPEVECPIDFPTAINAIQTWTAALSPEDRYKVWSIILPFVLQSPSPPCQESEQSRFEWDASGPRPARPHGEFFKSFRVGIDDTTRTVLPIALKKHNIIGDSRQYAMYIVHGDQKRCYFKDTGLK